MNNSAIEDSSTLPPPAPMMASDEPHSSTETPSDSALAEQQPKQKSKPAFEDVDSVLKALAEHDEILKGMKTQIQEMLTTNTALRRGIRQIVQDASKNDELATELAAAKKKLAVLKQYLG